jgi:hypothetical protein
MDEPTKPNFLTMRTLKYRVLSNWTFARVLYLSIGLAIVVDSIVSKQWLGILFGAYFASMGLFAFGCAAGNCFGGTCASPAPNLAKAQIQDIEYQELIQK